MPVSEMRDTREKCERAGTGGPTTSELEKMGKRHTSMSAITSMNLCTVRQSHVNTRPDGHPSRKRKQKESLANTHDVNAPVAAQKMRRRFKRIEILGRG